MPDMTDLATVNLDEFGAAAPFILEGVRCYREFEATLSAVADSARKAWMSGQAFYRMRENCGHGNWGKACERFDIDASRAVKIIHVFETWPRIEQVPECCGEVLIKITSPSAPSNVVSEIIGMAENGSPPSVRQADRMIAEEKAERVKASAPTAFNHDTDRTKQEPEDGKPTVKDARRLLVGIRSATQKAANAGVDWKVIQAMLENLAGESGDELVGLDDQTMNSMLRS